MKNKLLLTIAIVSMLVGCGNTEPKETISATESVHVHNYVEEITTAAGCETEGLKTFSCECGDIYTEVIPATGHIYEEYVSNEDATYLADGTESTKCNGCELTDTRTAEGSKLEYTYTELDKTMYANKEVNVRDLPSADGNKLGGLSHAQEVHVTGQCNETSWYRIEFKEGIAYVSNSYLVDGKPVAQVATQPSTGGQTVWPSGVPGDTDGDGIRSPEEAHAYIDPIEQACINAGYGNVVQIDATTFAVLTDDVFYTGIPAGMYLNNYLNTIGLVSGKQSGGWIDKKSGYYYVIGYECYSIGSR